MSRFIDLFSKYVLSSYGTQGPSSNFNMAQMKIEKTPFYLWMKHANFANMPHTDSRPLPLF